MIEPDDPRMARIRLALRRLGPADTRMALRELLTHHSGERVALFPRFVRGLVVAGVVILSLAGVAIVRGIRASYYTASVAHEPAVTRGIDPQAGDPVDRPGAVSLGTGELVIPVAKGTVFRITEKTDIRTVVSLESGAVQLRIRHDERRVFRVRAGNVEIEDLGTIFRVERLRGEKVHVAVLEGQVAVAYPVSGGVRRQDLFEGEDQVFPPAPTFHDDVTTSEDASAPPAPAQDRARVGATDSWRALAQDGQYGRAFRVLRRGKFRAVRDDPGEILLAADVARLSRHASASVVPLRRFLDRYPNDPRVPAAAFTLGWVLLKDVRRPGEAALAFATAERTAPFGNLAEDAAARGAEAWYQAGDLRRAKTEVARYLRMYPDGRYRTLLGRLIEER